MLFARWDRTYCYDEALQSAVTSLGGTTISSSTYTHDFAGRITAVAGIRADDSWTRHSSAALMAFLPQGPPPEALAG